MRLNAPAARLILSVLPAVPTVLALLSALALFALFLLVQGQPALDALGLIFQGAFGRVDIRVVHIHQLIFALIVEDLLHAENYWYHDHLRFEEGVIK